MRPAIMSISLFHSAKSSGRLITVAAMRAPAVTHKRKLTLAVMMALARRL